MNKIVLPLIIWACTALFATSAQANELVGMDVPQGIEGVAQITAEHFKKLDRQSGIKKPKPVVGITVTWQLGANSLPQGKPKFTLEYRRKDVISFQQDVGFDNIICRKVDRVCL